MLQNRLRIYIQIIKYLIINSMRQIMTVLFAVVLFLGGSVSARNIPDTEKTAHKRNRTEIVTYISSLPNVSVTYLTKSMLQKLPKDKAESPLSVLANKGGLQSVRVFQLGSAEAEAAGKELMDAYLSDTSKFNYAELLMLQKNGSNEVVIYGLPIYNDTSYYNTILMFSKATGKNTILIILSGKIHENTISELVDLFSK